MSQYDVIIIIGGGALGQRLNRILADASDGMTQGFGLFIFPAGSGVLLRSSGYARSMSEYGVLAALHGILAVLASWFGAELRNRFRAKRIFL